MSRIGRMIVAGILGVLISMVCVSLKLNVTLSIAIGAVVSGIILGITDDTRRFPL